MTVRYTRYTCTEFPELWYYTSLRLQPFPLPSGLVPQLGLHYQQRVGSRRISNKECRMLNGGYRAVATKRCEKTRKPVETRSLPHADMFAVKRIDVHNVEFEMKLPPTTVDKKYDLYVTILRKNRRYE